MSEDQDPHAVDDRRYPKSPSSFSASLQLIRHKRRTVLLVKCVFLLLFAIVIYQATFGARLSWGSSQHLDPIHLDYLATPLTDREHSNVDNETAYVIGEHHAVSGEYTDDYEWVDPYSRDPFTEIMYKNGMNNNAMGRMPAGSEYDVLVIARGRNGKYLDPTEEIPYVNLTIVG